MATKKSKAKLLKKSLGKHSKRQYASVSPHDYVRKAKTPGKRRSKSGKIYTETRPNRSDITRKGYECGGVMDKILGKRH